MQIQVIHVLNRIKYSNLVCNYVFVLLFSEKNGPYHKVVIKEIESTTAPGEKVKVFHCMSCNICVSALEQFKLHPCKTGKWFYLRLIISLFQSVLCDTTL